MTKHYTAFPLSFNEKNGEITDANGSLYAIAKAGILAEKCRAVGRHIVSAMNASDAQLAALVKTERFLSGFEGDDLQDGIGDLLQEVRAAIAAATNQQETTTGNGQRLGA